MEKGRPHHLFMLTKIRFCISKKRLNVSAFGPQKIPVQDAAKRNRSVPVNQSFVPFARNRFRNASVGSPFALSVGKIHASVWV
jgi:hypothetical protein